MCVAKVEFPWYDPVRFRGSATKDRSVPQLQARIQGWPWWRAQVIPRVPSVIELSLILSLGVVAAALAATMARWALSQSEGAPEALRVLGAVRRAGDDFAWRQGKRALGVALALGMLAFVAGPLTGTGDDASARPEIGVLAGTLLGALLCLGAGQLAIQIAPRASARVSTAMMRATHAHAVSIGLRAAAAITLGAETLAVLAVGGLVALLEFGSLETFRVHAPPLAAGLALGAVTAALWSQITGAAVHCAGQVGRRERRSNGHRERFELELENPALVVDLVGNHVGVSATRTQDAFCTSLLLHACVLSVVTRVWEANLGSFPNPWSLLALPILIRTFGLLGAGCAVFSLRADESDEPARVLWHGQVAAGVVGIAAIAGVCVWLLGDTWVPWFATASLGLGASLFVGMSRGQLVNRTSSSVKEVREMGVQSGVLALITATARSLATSWPTLAAIGASLWLGALLAEPSGLTDAAALALVLVASGFASSLPYLGTLALFDPIVDGACALTSLDGQRRPEVQHRAARMSQSALEAGAAGRGHVVVVSALIGVVALIDLPHLMHNPSAATQPLMLPTHALLGALLGLLATLFFSGVALRHSSRTANTLLVELQRQWGKPERTPQDPAPLPAEFRPRYAEHLALVCTRALHRSALLPLGVLLLPLVLLAARHALGANTTEQSTALLMFLLAFSVMTGLGVSLSADGFWALSSAARRQTRPKLAAELAAFDFVDSVAEFSGHALSPVAQLVAKGIVATSVVAVLVML